MQRKCTVQNNIGESMHIRKHEQEFIECPNCHEDLDNLEVPELETETRSVFVGSNGVYDAFGFMGEMEHIKPKHNPTQFTCPSCGTIIATNEKEAMDFLKGKPKKLRSV